MRVKKQKDKNRHVVGSQSASQPVSQSASQPSRTWRLIVPDKIKGEFSVFITNAPPDLQVITNGQVFPMFTQSPEVTR